MRLYVKYYCFTRQSGAATDDCHSKDIGEISQDHLLSAAVGSRAQLFHHSIPGCHVKG